MNHTVHAVTKITSYEAVLGEKARMGLTATLPREFLCKITPGMREEEYEELLAHTAPKTPSPSSHSPQVSHF